MFLPASINLSHPEKYRLSIRISATHFEFSMVEVGNEKNFCLRVNPLESSLTLKENITKIVTDLPFLTYQYHRTDVVFVTPKYHLIPTSYKSDKPRDLAYQEVESEEENIYFLTSDIESMEVSMVSVLQKDLVGFINRNLYLPHIYSHAELLIKYFHTYANHFMKTSRMHVYCYLDRLDIVAFGINNKLLIAKSYEKLSLKEQAYFILKLWEALKFDQMNDVLLFSGLVDDTVLDIVRNYFKNVERLPQLSVLNLWNKEALAAPLDLIYLAL